MEIMIYIISIGFIGVTAMLIILNNKSLYTYVFYHKDWKCYKRLLATEDSKFKLIKHYDGAFKFSNPINSETTIVCFIDSKECAVFNNNGSVLNSFSIQQSQKLCQKLIKLVE